MPTHQLDLNKEHLLEHECLRSELDLLRLEVDYINQDTKLLKRLLITTDMTLKSLSRNK